MLQINIWGSWKTCNILAPAVSLTGVRPTTYIDQDNSVVLALNACGAILQWIITKKSGWDEVSRGCKTYRLNTKQPTAVSLWLWVNAVWRKVIPLDVGLPNGSCTTMKSNDPVITSPQSSWNYLHNRFPPHTPPGFVIRLGPGSWYSQQENVWVVTKRPWQPVHRQSREGKSDKNPV